MGTLMAVYFIFHCNNFLQEVSEGGCLWPPTSHWSDWYINGCILYFSLYNIILQEGRPWSGDHLLHIGQFDGYINGCILYFSLYNFILQEGRLRSGDHILQIGNIDVRAFGSEQVAQVLRQAGSHVRLIVARPINEPSGFPTPEAPIIPTVQIDERMQEICAMLDKQDQVCRRVPQDYYFTFHYILLQGISLY